MNFNQKTLLWHDYETFGTDTKLDRPSQFAGIRTDENLNVVGDPIMFYCQPANDFLPNPMACKVTGVTPHDALEKGIPEYQFIDKIEKEMTQSNTCNVGYNSIAFDDEVTRFTLYRNFHEPYNREWKNGCSRWDIMNMMRLVSLTRPNALIWPKKEDGTKSFRLEELSAVNGIVHENAHDALSDVYATIGVAKKIKEAEPKLYDYLYNLRSKHEVSAVIKKTVNGNGMLVHIDSVYSGLKEFAAITYPICVGNNHTALNNNDVILVDLGREDFQDWINLPVDEIKSRIFSKKVDLEARGVSRPGFNKIAINQCPTIANYKVVPVEKLEQLNISLETCQRNLEYLQNNPDIANNISRLFEANYPPMNDPDTSLYAGFIDKNDRFKLDNIRKNKNFNEKHNFKDTKFHEMVFRYKARNFPSQLTDIELNKWEEYRMDRIKNGGSLTMIEFHDEIISMVKEFPDSLPLAKKILSYAKEVGDDEVKNYMKQLEAKICVKKAKLNP